MKTLKDVVLGVLVIVVVIGLLVLTSENQISDLVINSIFGNMSEGQVVFITFGAIALGCLAWGIAGYNYLKK